MREDFLDLSEVEILYPLESAVQASPQVDQFLVRDRRVCVNAVIVIVVNGGGIDTL